MMNAVKLAILGIALVCQLYDTQLLFTYRKLTYGSYQPPIDTKSWNTLISRFEEVVIYPPFATTNLEPMDYQYFSFLAGKAGKPITTGYVARINNKAVQVYNDSLKNRLDEGRLSPGSLYITTPANLHFFSFALQAGLGQLNYLDGYYYIFAQSKNDSIVLSVSDRLNSRHKEKIDSATKAIGHVIEFASVQDPQIVRAGAIHYNLEKFSEKGPLLSVAGWGFTETTANSKTDSVYVVLKGENKFYSAPLSIQERPDVTAHFSKQYLDNAGFNSLLFTHNVEKGVYTLAVAVKDKQGLITYTLTDKIIKVGVAEYATIEKTDNWPPPADIEFNMENINSDDKMLMIQGWAFLKNRSAEDCSIGIILKKEADLYEAMAEPMLRPDITAHFKNLYKLDKAGFTIKISKNAVPKGRYQLGVFIKDNKTKKEGMIFTGKEIDF
jgi:hypothetical protein